MKKILPYLILFSGAAYGLWPADLIPDIPFIGWIDDLGIMGAAIIIVLKFFLKKSQNSPKQQ